MLSKKIVMRNVLLSCSLAVAALPSLAQLTPVGLWHSIDDKTGTAKAEIRIREEAPMAL